MSVWGGGKNVLDSYLYLLYYIDLHFSIIHKNNKNDLAENIRSWWGGTNVSYISVGPSKNIIPPEIFSTIRFLDIHKKNNIYRYVGR